METEMRVWTAEKELCLSVPRPASAIGGPQVYKDERHEGRTTYATLGRGSTVCNYDDVDHGDFITVLRLNAICHAVSLTNLS